MNTESELGESRSFAQEGHQPHWEMLDDDLDVDPRAADERIPYIVVGES